MKKFLLTGIFTFLVLLSFGQKKTIGLYLKDLGSTQSRSFTSEILPQISKNKDVEFVLVDQDNYKNVKSFDYLLNITSASIIDKLDLYDYVQEKSKEVKGKDGKTKTVKTKVRHSGVQLDFSSTFYLRLMDMATQEFIYASKKSFKEHHKIADKAVRAALVIKKKAAKKAARSALFRKHANPLNKKRASYYEKYRNECVTELLNITIPALFSPAIVKEIVKEKKEKAKYVRVEGPISRNSFFAIEESNGSIKKIADLFIIPSMDDDVVEVGPLRKGRKKVYAAIHAGKKVVVVPSYSKYFHSKKCSILDNEIHVASIIQGSPQTLGYAARKANINNALRYMPNVKVYERQDIPDLSKLLSSESMLDDDKAFENRDKLVGVDYLFFVSGDHYDLLNVKSGEVDRKQLNRIKTDGSIKGNLKMAKKAMKSLLKHNTSENMRVSSTLSNALGIPSKIVKVDKEKKGKAKHVQIESLTLLDTYVKYKVFRIDEEKVGDKTLKREVEIGEVKTDSSLNGACLIGANVKAGGKKIMEALNEGKLVIVKYVKK